MLPDDVQIISVDDHVVEPPSVWQDRLPAKFQELGPRSVRDDEDRDVWMFEGEPHFNVGLGALLVVVPVFAETVFGGGPDLFGVLLGCIAVGELTGSVTIAIIRLPIPEGLAICLAVLLSGIAVATVAVSPTAFGVALGLTLYGAFSAPLTIWGQTLRMKLIPPGFHGRCFAIMRTLMQSGAPLGGVSAGFAVPLLGLRSAIAGIALITCLVGALGLTLADLRRAR